MAFTKYVYSRVNWLNKSESLTTPLGKTNLNRMDSAIYEIAENVNTSYDELSTGKLDKDSAGKLFSETPTWDSGTGIFKMKFYDGTEFQIDFNIEKIPVSFSMDENGVITMKTEDGTEWTADIGKMIPTYVYDDSDTIAFTDETDENDHHIKAEVKKNSITGEHLQTNYLAEIISNAQAAQSSAATATDSATNANYDAKLAQSYAVGGSGMRENEDIDNAKYYSEQAKESEETSVSSAESAKKSEETAIEKAESAETSEKNASASAESASNSSDSASKSAATATEKAESAVSSADTAKEYSEKAEESSTVSQSYAVGGTGTRDGENVDNAKYYSEVAKNAAGATAGGLLPMGTILSEQISQVDKQTGYMYNISDEFTSDETFNDGGGYTYPQGTNIYWTVDGYWDCLAGTPVTGVKGSNEQTFRRGNVNLTAENIGALAIGGDSAENIVSFTSADSTTATSWTDVSALSSGEKHKSIFNKVSTMFKNIRYIYNLLGTTDISSIGSGTVTSAISTLNSNLTSKKIVVYQEVTYGTNVQPLNNAEKVYCIKYADGTIFINGVIHVTDSLESNWLFTIPSDFMPKVVRQLWVEITDTRSTANGSIACILSPSGKCSTWSKSGLSSGWYVINMSY